MRAVIGCALLVAFAMGAMTAPFFTVKKIDDNGRSLGHNDGLPLALIHAGTEMANNHNGFGEITGTGIAAGQDIAVVLYNGRVWGRPNSLIGDPCGDSDPVDPEMANHSIPCRPMIDITDSTGAVLRDLSILGGPGPVIYSK